MIKATIFGVDYEIHTPCDNTVEVYKKQTVQQDGHFSEKSILLHKLNIGEFDTADTVIATAKDVIAVDNLIDVDDIAFYEEKL